ncbi:MAG: FkbM family methyltransferase [Leptospiraceae bacterium]|nr:FkbM family methyltransferase [Leptospiraceae bacterium]
MDIKKEVVEKVLGHSSLNKKPIHLVDIGASGEVYPNWLEYSKHSVCLAFDPDSRDVKDVQNKSKFKETRLIPNIVVDKEVSEIDFYLTSLPQCSSSLEPDLKELENTSVFSYFQIEKKIQLPAITLNKAVLDSKFEYIDYLKIDSQGTDLRIFKSLDKKIIDSLLAVDFEPGVMDAYKGEDKMYEVANYLDQTSFFPIKFEILGAQRANKTLLNKYFSASEIIYFEPFQSVLPIYPGWANMMYLRKFSSIQNLDPRSALLLFLFSFIQEQFGLCLEIIQIEVNDPEYKKIIVSLEELTVSAIKQKIQTRIDFPPKQVDPNNLGIKVLTKLLVKRILKRLKLI